MPDNMFTTTLGDFMSANLITRSRFDRLVRGDRRVSFHIALTRPMLERMLFSVGIGQRDFKADKVRKLFTARERGEYRTSNTMFLGVITDDKGKVNRDCGIVLFDGQHRVRMMIAWDDAHPGDELIEQGITVMVFNSLAELNAEVQGIDQHDSRTNTDSLTIAASTGELDVPLEHAKKILPSAKAIIQAGKRFDPLCPFTRDDAKSSMQNSRIAEHYYEPFLAYWNTIHYGTPDPERSTKQDIAGFKAMSKAMPKDVLAFLKGKEAVTVGILSFMAPKVAREFGDPSGFITKGDVVKFWTDLLTDETSFMSSTKERRPHPARILEKFILLREFDNQVAGKGTGKNTQLRKYLAVTIAFVMYINGRSFTQEQLSQMVTREVAGMGFRSKGANPQTLTAAWIASDDLPLLRIGNILDLSGDQWQKILDLKQKGHSTAKIEAMTGVNRMTVDTVIRDGDIEEDEDWAASA